VRTAAYGGAMLEIDVNKLEQIIRLLHYERRRERRQSFRVIHVSNGQMVQCRGFADPE